MHYSEKLAVQFIEIAHLSRSPVLNPETRTFSKLGRDRYDVTERLEELHGFLRRQIDCEKTPTILALATCTDHGHPNVSRLGQTHLKLYLGRISLRCTLLAPRHILAPTPKNKRLRISLGCFEHGTRGKYTAVRDSVSIEGCEYVLYGAAHLDPVTASAKLDVARDLYRREASRHRSFQFHPKYSTGMDNYQVWDAAGKSHSF